MRRLAILLTLAALGTARADDAPPSFGGRYPHLAVSNSSGECGIGAVVPWAGRLWLVTYAPHARRGSDDRLYEIDESLRLTARPESVGGTPAARFIHDATRQLVIGPYVIDERGGVRAVSPANMEGRLSAAAAHPLDPAGKVLVYDMEGLLYELDVTSLAPRLLAARAAPGWHGKGMYSGQGVVVVANNGEHAAGLKNFEPFLYAIPNTRASKAEAGVLAEWTPAAGEQAWRLVRRRQFTDVTGPGGIHGPPAADAPLWAVGWDEKSVLLLVRSAADAAAGRDPWHVFRLPKSCHSYDGDHGWHTEWPRIREVVPAAAGRPARYLLTMHGGWYEFPGTFSATATGGIRPLCTHLKITGDVAPWTIDGEERIVFGCDDAAKSGFKSEQQNLAGGGRRRAGCTRPGRPRRTTPPRQGVAHRARRLVRRGERDPEGGHENLPAAEAARSRGGGGACKTVRVGLAAGPAGGGHGAEPAPGGRHVLRAAAGVERWCRKDPARVQPLETDHRFLLVAQAARARRRQAGGHGRADHGSGRHIAGAGRQRHGRRDVPRRGRVGGRRGRTLETAARRPRSRTAESRP